MRSMTGYASSMKTTDRYDIFMELKSVNSRYFEFKIRSAYFLSEMEMEIKRILFESLQRGKVDLFIKVVEKNAEHYEVIVNYDLIQKYKDAFKSISSAIDVNASINLQDMITMDGVLTLERTGSDPELEELVIEMTYEVKDKIIEMMEQEGLKTKEDIINSLEQIDVCVRDIEAVYPESLDRYKNSLKDRIADMAQKGLDDSRILMEVELVSSRTAINEEVVRLKSHIKQFRDIVNGRRGGDSKKLDFISQELNREANTIASKSTDYNIIENTIAIKSEIEKIREQLRNLV